MNRQMSMNGGFGWKSSVFESKWSFNVNAGQTKGCNLNIWGYTLMSRILWGKGFVELRELWCPIFSPMSHIIHEKMNKTNISQQSCCCKAALWLKESTTAVVSCHSFKNRWLHIPLADLPLLKSHIMVVIMPNGSLVSLESIRLCCCVSNLSPQSPPAAQSSCEVSELQLKPQMAW